MSTRATNPPMLNRYNFVLIIILLCLVVGVLAIVFTIGYLEDPRQWDKNYCNDYAQFLDMRITMTYDQQINTDVAKRVCECQWRPHPEWKMYDGITECWRR